MKKLSLSLFLLWGAFLTKAAAQGCALCSRNAAASSNTEAAGKGLNAGIIYLAAVPLLFIGIVGYIWYKRMIKK